MATQPFSWGRLHRQFDEGDGDLPVAAPRLTAYQRSRRQAQPVATRPAPSMVGTKPMLDFAPPDQTDAPAPTTKPQLQLSTTRPRPGAYSPAQAAPTDRGPQTSTDRPAAAPAGQRFANPRELLGSMGIRHGQGGGFWRIVDQAAGGLGGVKGPNSMLVQNIAHGHAKKATNGGWIEQQRDGYTLYDAQGNVVERGQGMRPDLYDDAAQQQFQSSIASAAQASGAAAGGGAGGPGAPGAGAGASGQPGFESEIEALVRAASKGDEGPFTDDVRQNLRAAAKEDAAGQLASTNRMAALTAARSGNLYSGSTDETLAENARAAEGAVAQGNRAIDVQGAQANWDAKLKSRDQAIELMRQRREEAMANARNDIDRLRIKNEYDVALQNLQVQRDDIAARKEIADAQARGEAASARVNRDLQLEILDRNNQYDIDRFTREQLPFLLAGYGE